MSLLLNFIRLLLGAFFIFSGFIKAVDPLGFAYKLDEYFEVFGIPFLKNYSLYFSFFICYAEIIIGVLMMISYLINLYLISYMLIMILFTFLTFYSAFFDKVKDCGCFGDFMKLTPWTSFYKDLILLFLVVVCFVFKKYFLPIKKTYIGNSILILTTVWYIYFVYNNYMGIPVFDFRPYKIGNNIKELMTIPEGAPQDVYSINYTLKDKISGKIIEVNDKDYIEKNYWKDTNLEILKTSEPVLVSKGYIPPIHDFSLITTESGVDSTIEILDNHKFILMIISYDLNKVDAEGLQDIGIFLSKINKISNVKVIFTTSTNNNKLKDLTKKPSFKKVQFFNTDQTTLKTIVRSNPGLVLLNKGTVVKKWHYVDIPSEKEFKELIKN